MQAKVPQLSIQHAGVQTISIGQLGLGPISVGNLILTNVDLSMNAAQAILNNMTVTVTIHITVEWDVHVGLPDGIPDINIGSTADLGSFSFSLPVGNVTIPGLSNLKFHIPTLNAQNMAVSASPVSVQLTNLAADDIHASDFTMPPNGFTINGLTMTSLSGTGIGVPGATLAQATVGSLKGDAVKLPSMTLGGLQLPAMQIPSVSSSVPLTIPANLQGPSPGFDAGILKVVIHIMPSVVSHVDQLDITGVTAAASVGQIVLHDVTLPYDAHNLTLSRVGIDTINIPGFTVA
jgi:hypothetical protein